MRIKFEKGFTPELIGELFAEFVRKEDLIIGSVNIYVQTYDENMKPVKFNQDVEYYLASPSEEDYKEYSEDVAKTRRKNMKLA